VVSALRLRVTADSVRSVLPRASLVLLGLAWTVPFLQPYHHYPITAFYNEWLALALGLLAAVVLVRGESWRDAVVPIVTLAPLGLILLIGMQVAAGLVPYAEQALVAAFYLLWAILLMVLGRVLRTELGLPAVAECLAWFLLVGGLLNALAGLLQLYDAARPLGFLVADREKGGIYGNLAQTNHFSTHISMAVASAGYLYSRGVLRGSFAAPCLALFALVLALSGSRGPWLYLGLFTVLALALRRCRRDAETGRLAFFALWLLLTFALAQWVASLPLLQPERGLILTSAERLFYTAGGIEARWQLAREAWQMFLGAPWAGAGWGQFPWQHFLNLDVAAAVGAPGICNHAHNLVLQLLAETGLAGALLVLGAAVVWLWELRRARFDVELWWLLAILAVLGVHSLLEYPLWYAYFLGIAAPLAGLGSGSGVTVRRAGPARLLVALCLLSGAFNLIAVVGPYRDFERLVFDPELRAARVLTDEGFARSIARVYREPLLVPYVELVLAHAIDITAERLPEKLALSARAMHFAPTNVVVYRHAMLLALGGEVAAALRLLDRAASVYPGELDDAVRQLAGLARRHPAEFTPLLELAAARNTKLGASGALEPGSRAR
jgi:O-antigen ligase